jgi:hypothetical protein
MNSPKNFIFWKNWMLVVNMITILIGILIAIAGNSFIFEPHNQGTRELFFEGNSMPKEMLYLKNWLFGIIGATLAGFHLLIVFITQFAFAKKEKWARNAIASALVLWFVVDSSISIYYGAYFNLYWINFPSITLLFLPLLFTWCHFKN